MMVAKRLWLLLVIIGLILTLPYQIYDFIRTLRRVGSGIDDAGQDWKP